MSDTPFNTLSGFDQTTKLTEAVRNAYYLKNRDLPANLSAMVETLKKQILKRIPCIGVETLHENIESYILTEQTGAISTDLLYKAAARGYDIPRGRRSFDDYMPVRPDTERDTIRLLDTLYDTLCQGRRPYCNWHREFVYLVERHQIDLNLPTAYYTKAMAQINTERVADYKRPLQFEAPQTVADVQWRAEAIAVTEWLGSLIDRNVRPSDVLTPLINETSYQQMRKTV